MEQRLKNHIDILFQGMPQNENTMDVKEEITQNLIDKYHDLIAEGKDPETAYSMAVASIGNVHDLFPANNDSITLLIEKQKKKSALLITGAVMLYILSVIPVIICSEIIGNEIIGVAVFFIMIALATGMLIYNNITKYRPQKDNTMVNEFKQWQSGKPSSNSLKKQISGIIWSIIVIAYFLVSFLTGAWHITWILFIVGAVLNQIANLCISLNNKEK